jgi:hypothetical protein
LSPNFAALPAGAPSIPLSKVQATVTGQDDKSVTHEAQFANGSATLTFNVTVSGSSSKFEVEYAAFDLQGVLAYSGQQTITIHAGLNDSLPSPTLVPDGPDAKITALRVAPNPVTLYAGNTANLTPTGILPNEETITPRVGWTSSNVAIATISEAGVVSAISQGTATITATSRNGLTAAVPVTVNVVRVLPDSAEKLLGGTQQFSVADAPQGSQFVWTVNGVQGGNATFGTITASGFYTAPRTLPTPSTFQVCAAQAAATGCAKVVLSAIPTGGGDVIVLNDINLFRSEADTPNNRLFFQNLAQFPTNGVRGTQVGVLMHRGHSSVCGTDQACSETSTAPLNETLTQAGFTITNEDNTQATITAIPASIKVIFLWTPTVAYTNAEINVLKAFAIQGGRIVFVGEWDSYYTAAGIATENAFFASMGAQMTNTGGALDCGSVTLPAASLRPHQVTTGMTGLTIACASQVVPGPNDYPFLYDQTNTVVLGAVAKIDFTPLPPDPIILNRVPTRSVAAPVDSNVRSWGRVSPAKTP